ncbi:MAG TPA: phosphotransferase [Syntrophomonas sp.]|nr:phosphotransferase [Syntrophomonas sp.]HRW12651.1 phosphotransferase [Syntrophomonas sp.]
MPKREPLPSKKNHIYRERNGQQEVVVKQFTDSQRFCMEKEIGTLLKDSGLLTPRRIDINTRQQQIIYEYIPAMALVDLIETAEWEQVQAMMIQVCDWMMKFYQTMREKTGQQYILGDIHLRNFIYHETSGQVYGVDFEECRPGRIESDVARLLTFLLHYEPAFTARKIELADGLQKYFFAALDLDRDFYLQEVHRETEELMQRRHKNR